MNRSVAVFSLLLLFVVSGCYTYGWDRSYASYNDAPRFSRADDFEWRGRLDRGDVIEVKGVNGEIVAEPGNGNEVVVTAVKKGRKSDPGDVEIEVIEHRDGVTICAVYPGRGNSCGPGNEGRNNVRNNDVKVRFHVRVPEGVHFTGRTVNGEVTAERLTADVQARTVNGRIRIATEGAAEAETVNGAIEVRMGRSPQGDLHFETVNGSVTVEMPEEVNAEIIAKTVNGSIRTDFPVTVQGRYGARRLEGRIGRGGPEISISTVNGSIRLLAR